MLKYRAFICYETSSADDLARHLKHALENKRGEMGIATFAASQDLPKGPRWGPHRDSALKDCQYFVVLGTQYAITSLEVKKEIRMAENQKKFILPCRDSKHVARKSFLALFQKKQLNEVIFETKEELVREVEAVLRGMEDKGTVSAPYANGTISPPAPPSPLPKNEFLAEQWHRLGEVSPARVVADVERWLKRAGREQPLIQEAHRVLAQAYLMQGQRPFQEGAYRKAQGLYQKALDYALVSKDGKLEAEAVHDLGAAQGMLGYYDEASKLFDRAITLNSAKAEAYYNRGVAKGQQGDTQGAMADYDKALELDPRYTQAYNNRGTARELQGDTQGAMADYNQALELNPRLAQAYYNRGNARGQQGDTQGAIADCTKAIDLDPRLAQAYNNRGNAKGQQGDTAGAMADYNEALKLDPRLAQAYNNRGAARADKGDTEGAMADYDKALELDPRLAQAYYNRGNARGQQGDTQGAMADYNQALELNPRLAQAMAGLGLAHLSRSAKSKSEDDLRQALTWLGKAFELKDQLPDKGESITALLKQLEEAQEQKNG